MLLDFSLDNDSLDMTQKAQTTETKIDKYNCIKLKNSVQQRKQPTEYKGNLQKGKNVNHISDKGFIPKIHKRFI